MILRVRRKFLKYYVPQQDDVAAREARVQEEVDRRVVEAEQEPPALAPHPAPEKPPLLGFVVISKFSYTHARSW